MRERPPRRRASATSSTPSLTGSAAASSAPTPASIDELMAHVDSVWEPDARSARPGRAAASARRSAPRSTRFLDWHQRPGRPDRLSATEQQAPRRGDAARRPARSPCTGTPTGSRSTTTAGSSSIDLKTSKYAPTGDEIKVHPQLGLYQLAVENGAVDEVLRAGAEPGGAELWQLRHAVDRKLKVQAQEPQQPDESGHRPIETAADGGGGAVRAEDFPARPGGALRPLRLRAALSRQERRDGAVVTTAARPIASPGRPAVGDGHRLRASAPSSGRRSRRRSSRRW